MSSQKGNIKRTRPQKHQNKIAFKNNLHDTSHKTKQLNRTEITNVCLKCKNILDWKIKFKKYKVLKAPKTCTKCQQKTVKQSYHTLCSSCANSLKVCPKCGKTETLVTEPNSEMKPVAELKLDPEFQRIMKSLPERRRRAVLRFLKKKGEDTGTQPTIEEVVAMFDSLTPSQQDDDDDFGFSDDTGNDDDDDDDEDSDSG